MGCQRELAERFTSRQLHTKVKTILSAGVGDDDNTRRISNSPAHRPLKKTSLWARHFWSDSHR